MGSGNDRGSDPKHIQRAYMVVAAACATAPTCGVVFSTTSLVLCVQVCSVKYNIMSLCVQCSVKYNIISLMCAGV